MLRVTSWLPPVMDEISSGNDNFFPTKVVEGSTSLRAVLLHRAPRLDQTLTAVLAALARRFVRLQESGPADLLRAYRDLSVVLGRRVRVQPEQGPGVTAEVVAIESDLSLRLHGVAEPVTAGRLTVLRPGT